MKTRNSNSTAHRHFFLALASFLLSLSASAIDLGPLADAEFAEMYAFAEDRGAAIDTLFPRHTPWYVFSILHAQEESRLDDAEALIKAFQDSSVLFYDKIPRGNYDASLIARQAILRWDAMPDEQKTEAIRKLSQTLSDCRLQPPSPPARGTVQLFSPGTHPGTHPSVFNLRKEISRRIIPVVTNAPPNLAVIVPPDSMTQRNVFEYGPDFHPLPDAPGLFDHIVRQMRACEGDRRKPFRDELPFRDLTLGQLAALHEALRDSPVDPALAGNAFAAIAIRKLGPGTDEGDANDPAVIRAWLERIRDFARTLPPSPGNTQLLALALNQLLAMDLAQGDFSNRDDFLQYVRIPRATVLHPGSRTLYEGSLWLDPPKDKHIALDPKRFAGVVPVSDRIPDDAPLVKSFLEGLAAAGDDLADFRGTISGTYLDELLAVTAILSGKPRKEIATEGFSLQKLDEILHRIEVAWAPGNRREFAADDDVALTLRLKNATSIQVAIYDLSSHPAASAPDGGPTSVIDRGELKPDHVCTREFPAFPPEIRHDELLELPELELPGFYAVSCSSAGKECVAFVRKGRIRMSERTDADGHWLAATDTDGYPLPDAVLDIGGERFAADGDGVIHVPFATGEEKSGEITATVCAGRLTTAFKFTRGIEAPSLSFTAFLPMEMLLPGEMATLLLNPRLETSPGVAAPIARVGQAALELTLVDARGEATILGFDGLSLADDADAAVSFRVPERLAAIRATLSGNVARANGEIAKAASPVVEFETATKRTAMSSESIRARLSLVPDDPLLDQVFIRHSSSGYTAEWRGIAGEILPDQLTYFTFSNVGRGFQIALQSGADGIIRLGPLTDTRRLHLYSTSTDTRYQMLPLPSEIRLPPVLRAAAGEDFAIPLPHLLDGGWQGAGDLPTRVSLLARNASDEITDDFIGAASYANGILRIAGLPSGSYTLTLRIEEQPVRLEVMRQGQEKRPDEAKATAMVAGPRVPGIVAAKICDDGFLRVSIAHSSPRTRVHLYAHRFVLEGDDPFYALAQPPPYPWQRVPKKSMLPPEGAPCLDFLASPARLLTNLRPDADGGLAIPLHDMEGLPDLSIIAIDGQTFSSFRLAGPDVPLATRDIRHHARFTPGEARIPVCSLETAAAGAPRPTPASPGDRIVLYASVPALHGLLRDLSRNADPGFADFGFVAEWHTLSDAEKRALYGAHRCDGLDLFLYFKDRRFFDAVVAPCLAARRGRGFVTRWLLGEDLSDFAWPGQIQALGELEQCLLATRIPGLAKTLADRYSFRVGDCPSASAANYIARSATPDRPLPATPFWLDYARFLSSGEKRAFLSSHVVDLAFSPDPGSTAKLAALGLTGLPFEETSDGPAIVYRRTWKSISAGAVPDSDPVHVLRQLFDPQAEGGGASGVDAGQTLPTRRCHGLRTIFSNPTERVRHVEAIIPVPDGAVSLGNCPVGEGIPLDIPPLQSVVMETLFYFPTAEDGIGALAPAVALEDGVYRGSSPGISLAVSTTSPGDDPSSWQHILLHGSEGEILKLFRKPEQDPARIDAGLLAYREDGGYERLSGEFYDRLRDILSSRGVFAPSLWDPWFITWMQELAPADPLLRFRQYYRQADLREAAEKVLGPWFTSSLVSVHPRLDDIFESPGFAPLLAPRVLCGGGLPEDSRKRVAEDYLAMLHVLCAKPEPDDGDRLQAAARILLLGRDKDAMEMLRRIGDPESPEIKTPFDYLCACLALRDGRTDEAKRIAESYLHTLLDLWRNRFRDLQAMADASAVMPGQPSDFQ